MSRRVSLPGADELFRKTTLSAVPQTQEVPDDVVEVAATNRQRSSVAKSRCRLATSRSPCRR